MTSQTIYFAEFCPYGASTLSYYDELVRFASAASIAINWKG